MMGTVELKHDSSPIGETKIHADKTWFDFWCLLNYSALLFQK